MVVMVPHSAGRRTPSIVLPFQDVEYVSHIAIDIGGSLIKLVYFSTGDQDGEAVAGGSTSSGDNSPGNATGSGVPYNTSGMPYSSGGSRGGRLHFVKFETSRLQDALDFIEAKVHGLENLVCLHVGSAPTA